VSYEGERNDCEVEDKVEKDIVCEDYNKISDPL